MHAYGGARLEGRPAIKRARGRPGTASVSSIAEMGEKKKVGATKVRVYAFICRRSMHLELTFNNR
jgi:hypothetical protein